MQKIICESPVLTLENPKVYEITTRLLIEIKIINIMDSFDVVVVPKQFNTISFN